MLRIRERVIVLETMLWPDEIRTPEFPFLHQDVTIAPSELREATLLIDAMSERFTPDRYTDRYREALQELVQAKIDGNELVQPTIVAQQTGAADLVTALRTTLAAKQTRDSADPEPAAERVASARAAEDRAAQESATARKAASRTRAPSNC